MLGLAHSMQNIVCHSVNLCLLIGVFSLFLLNAIMDILGFNTIVPVT